MAVSDAGLAVLGLLVHTCQHLQQLNILLHMTMPACIHLVICRH